MAFVGLGLRGFTWNLANPKRGQMSGPNSADESNFYSQSVGTDGDELLGFYEPNDWPVWSNPSATDEEES